MRLLSLFFALAFCACDSTATQTILRFSAAPQLEVPEGSRLRLRAHRDGERQSSEGLDLGEHDFVQDTRLTVSAEGEDGARRFTVFAELLAPDGARLSWARIRSGFAEDQLSEVRVMFADGCPDPSDQSEQPLDYDPRFVCGSHDTCFASATGAVCGSACVEPEAFQESLSVAPSQSIPCPLSDSIQVRELEAGWDYSCGLTGDEAFCWGSISYEQPGQRWESPSRVMNPNGRTTAGVDDTVLSMRATVHHACAITMTGQLRCGGNDDWKGLGVRFEGQQPCCTVVPDLPPVATADSANSYTCVATREGGRVLCSGNAPGQDERTDTFVPYRKDGVDVVGIEALFGGTYLLAGFTDTGFEWLAAPPSFDTEAPVPAQEDVVDVAASNNGLCMVERGGALLCWGNDVLGTPIAQQPRRMAGQWRRIGIAQRDITIAPHRCAIDFSGRLWCWGSPAEGKLGGEYATPLSFDERVQVGTDDDWVDVATGQRHTCGIRSGGHVYCWGGNNEGQLGVQGPSRSTPVRVPVPNW